VKITSESTFDSVCEALAKYTEEAKDALRKAGVEEKFVNCCVNLYKHTQKSSKIAPVDCDEEVVLEGKDFKIAVKWDKFTVYSPDSDFQLSDPFYTGYSEKSSFAASKLYKLYLKNKDIVKNLFYGDLPKFFEDNKVCTHYIYSTWS
jgi:hypothetical protein